MTFVGIYILLRQVSDFLHHALLYIFPSPSLPSVFLLYPVDDGARGCCLLTPVHLFWLRLGQAALFSRGPINTREGTRHSGLCTAERGVFVCVYFIGEILKVMHSGRSSVCISTCVILRVQGGCGRS